MTRALYPFSPLAPAKRMEQLSLNLHPFRFGIECNIPAVRTNLEKIYGSRLSEDMSSIQDYSIKLDGVGGMRRFIRPQVRFFCDQKEPFKPLSLGQAYAFLEWGMNWTIAAHEVQNVIIHSAVLAKGDKAILFPAPPGSGKSTITAYLAFNGWRLLSDEMALINPNTLEVTPFVRPICLKNQSIDLARNWFPEAHFSTIAKDTHKGDVIHLSPPEFSWEQSTVPAKIVGVVFPKYMPNNDLTIYQLSKLEAFAELANNAFNYGVAGKTGFETLTKVIDQSSCFEIHHSQLSDVKEFLEQDIIQHA